MNTPMAEGRRYELDELLIRPGTYFNPQTEVLVVVDDSQSMADDTFNMEEFEGADWVAISDDVPIDEAQRDEMLETFQATYTGDGRAVGADTIEDADELEPDEDVEELDAEP